MITRQQTALVILMAIWKKRNIKKEYMSDTAGLKRTESDRDILSVMDSVTLPLK